MGPMIHSYIPRQDPPMAAGTMYYPGQQAPGYLANGAVVMQPQPAVGMAPMTAPVNPTVMYHRIGQPMVIQNQAVPNGAPLMLPGQTQAIGVGGYPAQPPVHVDPAMGVGLTPNETIAQNIRIAQNNKAYEPQDFKPADPDPYRKYWFRELNGHWALFDRRQIDRLEGQARWYRTDEGVFYAIRLCE
ncbi:hypothetical protein VTI74DRAFT_9160 [Chaetomium olivicolor]